MSEHMLRKGATWWRHAIIMHKMSLAKLNTLFCLLPVLLLLSLNVMVYVFLTVWTLESWKASCSIEKKLVLCVCLSKGINSEGRTGSPLDIGADPRHLYSCAGEEKQKVHLSCAPDLRTLTQSKWQKQEKSRRSSLRSTPTRRLIDRIELVLKICVTQACCHAPVRMQQAKWVKLV